MQQHTSPSEYTLATVLDTDPLLPQDDAAAYGSTQDPPRPSSSRLLLTAALRMAALFLGATLILGGTLFLALPTLSPDDRSRLHIPKSFDDLKALNSLMKKYRDIYPKRMIICYVTTYLFLQAFSLPGSLYLSILGGAVWGVPVALPIVCTCVATGASLCYLISAAFGPALHTVPRWKAYLDTWSEKLRRQKDNIFSFLIILRIAPLPPHWVINIVCPHVGIGVIPFWSSTWLGIFGPAAIHTTIGGGLDEMTSTDDFHIISWKNFFLVSAIVVGVLIPVGLRYYFKRQVASVTTVDAPDPQEELPSDGNDNILAAGPAPLSKKASPPPLDGIIIAKGNTFYDDRQVEQDDVTEDDDDDEDVILEAGPAIVIKPPQDGAGSGSVTH